MKEILINGEKLKLIKVADNTGYSDTIKFQGIKRVMYRQFLVGFKNQVTPWHPISVAGNSSHISTFAFTDVWALVKTKDKTIRKYTEEEYRILLGAIGSSFTLGYLELCEKLCISTKDENLIKEFYSCYSGDRFNKWLIEKYKDKSYTPAIRNKEFPRQYRGARYSIYELIKDLVNEKEAKVLLDAKFIGEYQRISKSKKKVPENVEYNKDDWSDIKGILGNKERANLSLLIQTPVSVTIPEETKKVKAIKSVNIIKDGIRNMDFIGVSVGKKLESKLIRTGCVDFKLIWEGELILNLNKLPVVSTRDIKHTSAKNLAEKEFDLYIAKLACMYYERKDKTKPEPLSDREKYLRSFGIDGSSYIPVGEKPVSENKSYDTIALETNISGLPKNNRLSILTLVAVGLKSNVRMTTIEKKLVSFMSELKDEDRKQWIDKKNKLETELKDKKFQIILSKLMIPKTRKAIKSQTLINDTGEFHISWTFKQKTIKL